MTAGFVIFLYFLGTREVAVVGCQNTACVHELRLGAMASRHTQRLVVMRASEANRFTVSNAFPWRPLIDEWYQ